MVLMEGQRTMMWIGIIIGVIIIVLLIAGATGNNNRGGPFDGGLF